MTPTNKRKAILLSICLALLLLGQIAAPLAAARLAEGERYTTLWKSLQRPKYKFNLTVTGLPSLDWAGGKLALPYLALTFGSGGHSPCWTDLEGKVGGWEEVKFGQTSTPAGETWRIVGRYEGFAVYNTILLGPNSVEYHYAIQALYPRKGAALEVSGSIYRASKSQVLPFTATLLNGESVTGNLNKQIGKLQPVKAVEMKAEGDTLTMKWELTGTATRSSFYTTGNPETMQLEAGEIAAIRFQPQHHLGPGDELILLLKLTVSSETTKK